MNQAGPQSGGLRAVCGSSRKPGKSILAAVAFLVVLGSPWMAGAQPYGYVSTWGTTSVTVVNLSSGSVIATIPMDQATWGISVTPDGRHVYAGNYAGGTTVAVIDTLTNEIVKKIPLGGTWPWGIVVNPTGTRAYVSANGSQFVAVIDMATNDVIATVPLQFSGWHDSLSGLALSPDGGKLFVTHFGWGGSYNRLSIVDTASMETGVPVVTRVDVGTGPEAVAVHPWLPRAYVAQSGYFGDGHTLSVVDTGSAPPAVIATVEVGSTPGNVVVRPDGERVYVSNNGSNTVSVVDPFTNNVTATIPVGMEPVGLSFGPDGRTLYVANWGSDSLSVVDTESETVTGEIALPAGSHPAAFGAFVTNGPDATPPTITIAEPTARTFLLGQVAPSSYDCADLVSGVALCVGTVPNGSPIDTSTVGAHAFSVTATDAVGNTTTSTVTYTVAYGQCVLFDQTVAHKVGSTIPIKLQLCDAAGANVSSAAVSVVARAVHLVSTSAPGPLADSGSANPDDQFRFVGDGYIFNLSLKGFTVGTYAMVFKAGTDPTEHIVEFQVR